MALRSRGGRAPLVALAAALSLAISVRAQAPPPVGEPYSLEALVAGARVIAVTRVTNLRAAYEYYGASRLIVTTVTLQVEQAVKGAALRTLEVEVLGGSIGDETLRVSHVPEFKVGDRDVVFLSGEPHAVSPLVGSDQGRFRVVDDPATRQPRVLTSGWRPLRSVGEIVSPPRELIASMSSAMTLDRFVATIRDTMRALEARRP
jgi:hypothetical protein